MKLDFDIDYVVLSNAFYTSESCLLKDYKQFIKEYYQEHKWKHIGPGRIRQMKWELRKLREYINKLEEV